MVLINTIMALKFLRSGQLSMWSFWWVSLLLVRGLVGGLREGIGIFSLELGFLRGVGGFCSFLLALFLSNAPANKQEQKGGACKSREWNEKQNNFPTIMKCGSLSEPLSCLCEDNAETWEPLGRQK